MRLRMLLVAVSIAVTAGPATAGGLPAGVIPPAAAAFLERPDAPPLSGEPVAALIASIDRLSAALGFHQSSAERVHAAGPSEVLGGRLAATLDALLVCTHATHRRVLTGRDDIHACAANLWSALSALEHDLRRGRATAAPLTSDLDVWPVMHVDQGGSSVYRNDYLLIVDLDGDDVYANNAGSNVVDLNYAPDGSAVPGLRGTGPARGCQNALGGILADAGIAHEHNGMLNGDCQIAAAAVLDLNGQDRYGVLEDGDVDAKCTSDPVVRRMMTGGAGFAGAGILFDADPASDDVYLGKTGALGVGHFSGVGLLRDAGGDDRYQAVRNSIGFSLGHALGILHDEAGDDRYDYVMPAPLDPEAANQTDGSGGVTDDTGSCDNRPRFVHGAANLGGFGLLLDEAGDDVYRGGYSDDFAAYMGTGRGGSLGFGNNGGVGMLWDRAGADSYEMYGNQGAPERGDGVVITPDPSCGSSTCSGGVFADE